MRRASLVMVVLLAGCGGAQQGADEPSGTFKVQVVNASFPRVQHIAQAVVLRLRVRNADTRALPVAVTVQTRAPNGAVAPVAFGQGSLDTSLASSARPVWVLDRGPYGGDTAYVNTWSAGTLRPGASRLLTWRLVAVKAGSYTISYSVSPGLTGKGRAAAGQSSGSVRVRISDEPVPAHVGAGGRVIEGSPSAAARQ